jgi:hypothetical protein
VELVAPFDCADPVFEVAAVDAGVTTSPSWAEMAMLLLFV